MTRHLATIARAIVDEMGPLFGPPERLADPIWCARQDGYRLQAGVKYAKAALEASHHAELVAENARLRTALQQIHDLADGLLNDIEAEEAQS